MKRFECIQIHLTIRYLPFYTIFIRLTNCESGTDGWYNFLLDFPTVSASLGDVICCVIFQRIFCKDPAERPSSSELLREPLIANHIKDMIKRLERTNNKLDDLERTMDVRSDRTEIARALLVNKLFMRI